jgi:hypothetical protein
VDVDNPARQPFVCFTNLVFSNGGANFASGSFIDSAGDACTTIPVGKRAVIEFVTGTVTLPFGQRPLQLVVQAPLSDFKNGGIASNQYPLVMTPVGSDGSGNDVFGFSQTVRIYEDGGTQPLGSAVRNATTGDGSGAIQISGYFVSLP